MNLLELINEYKSILSKDGEKAAKKFLVDVGAHIEVRKAIIAIF